MIFYNEFCSIHLKRNSRSMVKQSLIGALVSLLFIIVYQMNNMWGNIIITSYCLFAHILCMIENDTFLSYEDLKIFDLKENTIQFKLTYILQRILNDTFITNAIVIISILVFLLIKMNFANALFFITLLIMSIILTPSYNVLAQKLGEQGVIAFVTALVIGFVAIIVGSVYNIFLLNWFFAGNSLIHSTTLFIFTIIYMFQLDFICKHFKRSTKTYINSRFFFAWLKPINVFLFKDYVLFYKHVLMNLIMIFTLYAFVLVG